MTQANAVLSSRLSGIQWPALLIGVGCLTACAAGGIRQPHDFFPAYLYAYMFWLGITLGSLAMVMLFHCTGGLWGRMIGRLGESASLTLPLMIVLFLPIVAGMHDLYAWSQPRSDVRTCLCPSAEVSQRAVLSGTNRWLFCDLDRHRIRTQSLVAARKPD